MISNQYSGSPISYFDGSVYSGHVIGVSLSEDLATMTFTTFDPLLTSKTIPSTITGSVDLEAGTVKIPVDDSLIDIGLSSNGFWNCAMVEIVNEDGEEDLDYADEFVITFSKDGTKMTVPPVGTYVDGEGFYELCWRTVYEAL